MNFHVFADERMTRISDLGIAALIFDDHGSLVVESSLTSSEM